MKIRDHDGFYDSLLGYFPANIALTTSDPDVNLTRLYTYHTPATKPAPTNPRIYVPPTGRQYPRFTPFYNSVGKTGDAILNPAVRMQVSGAIMDPFLPVYAFSAILPNKAPQLAQWTVQDALSKITAFQHVGPLAIPLDMPPVCNRNKGAQCQCSGPDGDGTCSCCKEHDIAKSALAKPKVAPAAQPTGASRKIATASSNACDNSIAPTSSTPQNPTQILPKVAISLTSPAPSSSGANSIDRYLHPYTVSDSTDDDKRRLEGRNKLQRLRHLR